ncbi:MULTISPECIES: hypothetical protein [Staphylococcus]|uniref:hypothetical protein n=1 Tax=Staphylococcus TaxID=1279 RepID=UPI0005C7C0A0|nr:MULTISPECIES: hypothetical protein [Staphylococcus]MDG4944210.1 hypothetical protein [Staphylococcus agnetis]HDH6082995.1 hypothetical protein [Staphylococcus aureus]
MLLAIIFSIILSILFVFIIYYQLLVSKITAYVNLEKRILRAMCNDLKVDYTTVEYIEPIIKSRDYETALQECIRGGKKS